ncbi:MAG TPA: nucleotidyltransferase family protein [Planctomycetota bacterium]|nr:nucleotidyltransferase family protein [Planctomycetota bacterium]
MSIKSYLIGRRNEILQIAKRHGAHHVRVFGSVARGDDDESSDVDFLVSFDKNRSLMDHAALLVDLEQFLSRKVDVASETSLRPKIKSRVLREAVEL